MSAQGAAGAAGGLGAGSALLVIDVQQQPLSELSSGERRAEFLAVLASLVERARERGMPVVYVRHSDEWMRPGSDDWQIASEVAPLAGEAIVEKRFRDAFRETDLAEVLGRLGAGHLIVCGMQTEFGIDATIREAERRGYRVDLVGDAHATGPAGGLSEEQIRTHVHRVAEGAVARIVRAADLF
jgi:nicotinamidase-related amidase